MSPDRWTCEFAKSLKIRARLQASSVSGGLGVVARSIRDPAAFDARVKGLRGDLVEWARLQTHDQLGDGRRALAVAVRWLRPKVLGDDLPLPE